MTHSSAEVGYRTGKVAPFVFEANEDRSDVGIPLDDRVMIDVIHDGATLPPEYLVDGDGRRIAERSFYEAFVVERDWGANLVAARIAQQLGLRGHYTVTTARCLLDFGRFPGITRAGAPHLRRFAINHPFSTWLGFEQCSRLLGEHYDGISAGMDHAIEGKELKLAVHTYDRYNDNGTERPAVSLITRALGVQENHELPFGVFDPLFPAILSEFTVDRILRDRISLTLETSGVPVAHNYPYLLPEGSPEVRHQVFSFFRWLQRRFVAQFPESADNPAYQLVWRMVRDTNLRSAEASSLRSFLHLYRRPRGEDRGRYEAAERAYRHLQRFVESDRATLVADYRFEPGRAMSMGIEVRKDLIWAFDEFGFPDHPEPSRAYFIADRIADAILTYFRQDRPRAEERRAGGVGAQQDAWHEQAAQGGTQK